MTEFPLDIVTPDGEIFSGRAESLRLRSIEGDLCIRARHKMCIRDSGGSAPLPL